MSDQKIIIAKASFVRHSPKKLRPVARAVANMKPAAAISALKLMPQKGAEILMRVVEQAVANAKNVHAISPDTLTFESIAVMGGPRVGKKSDVHAHGARFGRGIRVKRLSHILVRLKGGANGAKS